jgi:hypothetical protein
MSHKLDPDALVQCPFDKNHMIAASKLHNHILKCKKNHPELDKILEKCPFNALHRFLPDERDKHILECIDKDRVLFNRARLEPIPPTPVEIEADRQKRSIVNHDEEDWDNGRFFKDSLYF